MARTPFRLPYSEEAIEFKQIIDTTDTEAFLVRKANDGGDIFKVDTLNKKSIFGSVGNLGSVTHPLVSFGDGDTGFYEPLDDTLSLSIAGSETWVWDNDEFKGKIASGPAILNENASSTNPTFVPNKTDGNTGIGSAGADQLSLIAGGVEMLRLVETGTSTTDQIIIAPAGIIGSASTPSLAFGDGDTGFYESDDDVLKLSIGGSLKWFFRDDRIHGNEANGASIQDEASSATNPTLSPSRSDLDTGIGSAGADQLSLIAGNVEAVRYSEASGEVLVRVKASVGQTAHTGSSQGDGIIISSYNIYTTVGTAGDAATLPATFPGGTIIYIKNDDGSNAMDIFPASGNDLGAGANTPLSLTAGKGAIFLATAGAATWTNLLEGI